MPTFRIIILTIMSMIASLSQSQLSSPLVRRQSSYFQSGVVLLVRLSTTTMYEYPITYSKPKSLTPYLFISYGGVDYNINKIYPANNSIMLSVKLNYGFLSNTGFTAVAQAKSPVQVGAIKYSYLAIDQLFPYFGAFQLMSTTFTGLNGVTSFNHRWIGTPIIAIYLYGFTYEIYPYNNPQTVGLHWQVATSTLANGTLTSSIRLRSSITSYSFYQTQMLAIAIYPSMIPPTLYQVLNFTLQTTTPLTTTLYPSSLIQPHTSTTFYGLQSFYISAVPSSPLQSFKFNFTVYPDQFQLRHNQAFSKVKLTGLIIYQLVCPEGVPFRRLNSTIGGYECYDYCLSTQHSIYNASAAKYQCLGCVLPCVECYSAARCKVCVYYMDVQEDGTCVQKPTYAIVAGVVKLCSAVMTGCETCTVLGSTCVKCADGYAFMSTGVTCTPCSSIHLQCLTCTNETTCTSCTPNFVLQTPTECTSPLSPLTPTLPLPTPCQSPLCSSCLPATPSHCLTCTDPQLYLTNGQCQSQCGDGKVMPGEECDDGNLEGMDGCDQGCKVEDGFKCQGDVRVGWLSKYNRSRCYFDGVVGLQVTRVVKVGYENVVRVDVDVKEMRLRIWGGVDFGEILSLGNMVSTRVSHASIELPPQLTTLHNITNTSPHIRLLQSTSPSATSLTLSLAYTTTIHNLPLTLTITPSLSGTFALSRTPPFSTTFSITPDNNHLANFYSQSVYEYAKVLEVISVGLGWVVAGLVVIGCFVGNLLVAMEVVGVVQVAWFMLLTVGEVNPCFYAVTGLRYSNGYTLAVFDTSSTSATTPTSRLLTGMGLSPSLPNNLLLTLLLTLLPLLIGLTLTLITKLLITNPTHAHTLTKISSNCIGSLGFYLVLCLVQWIVVAATVAVVSGGVEGIGWAVIGVGGLVVVGYVGFFVKCRDSECFSKLTERIGRADNKGRYLLGLLAMRVACPLIVTLMSVHGYFLAPTIIIFFVYLIYTLLLTFTRLTPYPNSHKIRLTITHTLLLLILSIYCCHQIVLTSISHNNSTSSQSQSPYRQKDINLYLPFSIVGLLCVVVLVNVSFYVYSVKALRCCVLEIQWGEVEDAKLMKEGRSVEGSHRGDGNVGGGGEIGQVMLINDDTALAINSKNHCYDTQSSSPARTTPHNHNNSPQKQHQSISITTTRNGAHRSQSSPNIYPSSSPLKSGYPSPINPLPTPPSHRLLQQQIKKQLRSSCLPLPTKKPPLFPLIAKPSLPTDSIYSRSNKALNSHQQKNRSLSKEKDSVGGGIYQNYCDSQVDGQEEEGVSPTYTYTKKDTYCVYEEFDRI